MRIATTIGTIGIAVSLITTVAVAGPGKKGRKEAASAAKKSGPGSIKTMPTDAAWDDTVVKNVVDDKLYTIQKDGTFQVFDPVKATRKTVSKLNWAATPAGDQSSPVRRICGMGGAIYVTAANGPSKLSTLFRINPADGSSAMVGAVGSMEGSSLRSCLAGQLFTVESDGMIKRRVPTANTWHKYNDPRWTDAVFHLLNGRLLLQDHDNLNTFDIKAGSYPKVSWDKWPGKFETMAGIGGKFYVVLDPGDGDHILGEFNPDTSEFTKLGTITKSVLPFSRYTWFATSTNLYAVYTSDGKGTLYQIAVK